MSEKLSKREAAEMNAICGGTVMKKAGFWECGPECPFYANECAGIPSCVTDCEYFCKKWLEENPVGATAENATRKIERLVARFLKYCVSEAESFEKSQNKEAQPIDSEWQELKIDDLPRDIDVSMKPKHQYDIEFRYIKGSWEKTNHGKWWLILKELDEGTRYRYRGIQTEKKQPPHEDIMTLWWENNGLWFKVCQYYDSKYYAVAQQLRCYFIDSYTNAEVTEMKKEDFIGLKSATIPTESND